MELLNFLLFFVLPEFALVFFMILIHELGHYVEAKRLDLYVGWGLLPQPHIELKHHFPSRWSYLSGLIPSLILTPVWCLMMGWDSWYFWILICLGAAIGDLAVFFGFGLIIKREKADEHGKDAAKDC